MFEGVSLGSSSSDIKELPLEHHGGVGLPGAAGPGEDDGLGVAGLSLHPDGLLGHAVEILSRPGRLSGGVEGDGVAHIIVRIYGEKDRANIGLETVGIESKVQQLVMKGFARSQHTLPRLELPGAKYFQSSPPAPPCLVQTDV